MKTSWIWIVVLSAALAACTPKQDVDRLLVGGVIHTGVAGAKLAEVVAIKEGRIVYVGTKAGAKAYQANTTTDLGGAHVFPGFTDAHAHLFGIGERETNLNLAGIHSLAEMLAAVRQEAKKRPEGNIVGRGWIETHWPEGRFPNRYDLDSTVPGRVVILGRADGHALVASSSALDAVGLGPQTVDPDGGRIERDGEGAPSGILIDYAMNLLDPLLQEPIGEQRRPVLLAGAKVMAKFGWTGMHNMSVSHDDVIQLEALTNDGELPLRVYNSIDVSGLSLLEAGPRFSDDHKVITRAIKIYTDGALGSRGAALLAPYSDAPDTDGLMLTSREQTAPLLAEALSKGWQIAAHAIGDKANREMLTWMETAFAEAELVTSPRWRIEHAQMVHPTDIARFAALGVIPSMQPSHAIGDLYFAGDRVGLERLVGAYAWQSLIDAGSIIAGGSDAPVEQGDPKVEFYAATIRAGLDGFQGDGWHKEEAVARETALKMFTLWPAFASFQEDELGTVEVGKRADFTVFDRDLMTVPAQDILEANVLWTIVDGQNTYKAEP